jgi:hypothetical protein
VATQPSGLITPAPVSAVTWCLQFASHPAGVYVAGAWRYFVSRWRVSQNRPYWLSYVVHGDVLLLRVARYYFACRSQSSMTSPKSAFPLAPYWRTECQHRIKASDGQTRPPWWHRIWRVPGSDTAGCPLTARLYPLQTEADFDIITSLNSRTTPQNLPVTTVGPSAIGIDGWLNAAKAVPFVVFLFCCPRTQTWNKMYKTAILPVFVRTWNLNSHTKERTQTEGV